MALYEYACEKCGERVEIIQRYSDPPYKHCPKCGGDMRKLISSPAIQFKGSGFYKTDYASSTSTPPKTDAKTETRTESKSESKTETKTETKSDTKADK
jgi:putative FmdB family regulatory protein